MSLGESNVALRRRRFCFGVFLENIWFEYALFRRTFPLAVARKRLAALLFVFILGMDIVLPLSLLSQLFAADDRLTL